MDTVLVGIDVGTSAIKVGAFRPDGSLVGLARRTTPTTRLEGGRAEHDPEELWAAVADALGELVAGLPPGAEIAALACDSVGEGGLPLDASHTPVRPAMAWFDTRASGEVAELERAMEPNALYRLTGQALDPHYGLLRLLWLRRAEPSAFARTAVWASLADWIALRLTGELATDPSLASRTYAFDQAARTWSGDLLAELGLSADRFPRVLEAGSPLGPVTREAARATGLAAGVPVVVGGHDRLCAALAARAGGDGPIDSTGSAEALVRSVDRYRAMDPVDAGHVSHYADIVPGRYVYSARVGYAGALVDWFDREVRGEAAVREGGTTRLDAIVRRPLAWSGLLAYPTFGRVVAPTWDPATLGGMIVGLTLAHGHADIVQALVEATCFSLRANLENLERITGRVDSTIAVEGTITADPTWIALKAAVTGREVVAIDLPEATALGTALLAGVGVGLHADHAAASRAVVADRLVIGPDPELAATFDRVYRTGWTRLPGALAGLVAAKES